MDAEQRELDGAIDALYDAFAEVELRRWTDPCLHCHTEDEERALHVEPLRAVPIEAMEAYAGSALWTWGDGRDLRYFTPRLLEVVADHDLSPGIESLFGRLRLADWHTWTTDQVEAVRRFAVALWHRTLTEPAGTWACDEVLCAVAQIEDDLQPYLDRWIADGRAQAGRHLVHLIAYEADVGHRRLRNEWWPDRIGQQDQVLRWLDTAPVADRLATVVTEDPDAEMRALAELAFDRVPLFP